MKYGKPQSSLQKFMSADLYLLPPQILPCEHVDTPTLRYLNTDFAPLRHPFGKDFNIESYNTSWLEDKPVSRPPDFLLDETFFNNSAKKLTPLSEIVTDIVPIPASEKIDKPLDFPLTQLLPNTTTTTDICLDENEFSGDIGDL